MLVQILKLNLFRKYVEKIQVLLKSDKSNGYFMFRHVWQYLAELFLEWEMFHTKAVEEIKIDILCSIIFFRKSCPLWGNVEKYGGASEDTNDVTMWRIRVACWISKATCTHARVHTHTQQRFPNASERYVLVSLWRNSRTSSSIAPFFRFLDYTQTHHSR